MGTSVMSIGSVTEIASTSSETLPNSPVTEPVASFPSNPASILVNRYTPTLQQTLPSSAQFPKQASLPDAHPSPLKSFLSNLIAGGAAGFCVVLVGYPFDLLKVRLQTSHDPVTGTLRATVRQIWQSSGLRGFYQGASAPFLGVTPIFAVNFYGYALGKHLYERLFIDRLHHQHSYSFDNRASLGHCAFAGAFSALQTSMFVIPAERVKVVMQMPRGVGSEIAGMNAIGVASWLIRKGGIRALYRGATATLTRDVPGLTTFFTTYETIKYQLQPSDPDATLLRALAVTTAGGLAGMTSWMVSLPSDVLKSRMQAASPDDPLAKRRWPTLFILRDLLSKEGPTALYRGLYPVLLRAFPANAACFLGYEGAKAFADRLL